MEDNYLVWVCGGIDSHGVITAHAYRDLDEGTLASHTAEERGTGTCWRFCGFDKMLMEDFIPQSRNLNNDEIFKIEDWLIKHGYLKDDEELLEARTIRMHAKRDLDKSK